jgi:hypothetical protein
VHEVLSYLPQIPGFLLLTFFGPRQLAQKLKCTLDAEWPGGLTLGLTEMRHGRRLNRGVDPGMRTGLMATSTLTIQVSEEAARAFAQVSPEDQRKIQSLLDLRLRDLTISPLPRRFLQAVMNEIGKNAAARGLTPAGVESLLNDT